MSGSRRSVPRAKKPSRKYRAQTTMSITYLTPPTPAFKRMVEATPPGMAYWPGTGPPDTVCGQCGYHGYGGHPNSCLRYHVMVFKHGAAFPAETPSCREFEPRDSVRGGAVDRWMAEIRYRTDRKTEVVAFEELRDLHDIIEHGSDWNEIEQIVVTLNRSSAELTQQVL